MVCSIASAWLWGDVLAEWRASFVSRGNIFVLRIGEGRLAGREILEEARIDRQAANTDSSGGEDGVGDCWCERRYAGLAHATWRVGAGHDMDFNIRRLIQSQDLIIVKVALFHGAIFNGDLAAEHRSQSKVDGAFGHGAHAIGIHGGAAVDSGHDPTHAHGTILLCGDLRHVSDVAAKGPVTRDAPSPARRKPLAPARFFRCEL